LKFGLKNKAQSFILITFSRSSLQFIFILNKIVLRKKLNKISQIYTIKKTLMKFYFPLLILILFFSEILTAQNEVVLTDYQQERLEDEPEKMKVLFENYTLLRTQESSYQIQLGFGSYTKAQGLLKQANQIFGEFESRIEFQTPTYRVRLGNFNDRLEAERIFAEVRKKFPSAILIKP
tara:strand:- start:16034 stop:16567 length:534 start_codon:yes stop_codon:yes gene_type:complete